MGAKMKKYHRHFVIAGITSLLTIACSSNPPLEQVEKAHQAPATRIGLLTIAEPTLYEAGVLTYDLPNMGFTLPGRVAGMGVKALTIGLDRASHNRQFTASIHKQGFKISEELTAQISKMLEQVGYQVVPAPVEDHRHTSEFRGYQYLGTYPQTEPPVDFYLHVNIDFAGYTALTHEQPLMPTLRVHTQLISLTGRGHINPVSGTTHDANIENINHKHNKPQLLYSSILTYGGVVPVSGPNDMPADTKYSLRSMEHIQHPEHVTKGLKAASIGIATLIRENLK